MLYPAELQALLQLREVTLAQGFNLCLLLRDGQTKRDGREKRDTKVRTLLLSVFRSLTHPACLTCLANLVV